MKLSAQKKLSLALLDWHGGMPSGLYAVGSCILSDSDKGRKYSVENHRGHDAALPKAIRELRKLREQANHPECVTKEMEQECNALADKLEAFIPKEASK